MDQDCSPRQSLRTLNINEMDSQSVCSVKSKKSLNDFIQYVPEEKERMMMLGNKSPEKHQTDSRSENYWCDIAETRRRTLEEALVENEQLWKTKDKLMDQKILYKKLIEEVSSFVETFKEIIDDNDDTGIDEADVSQNDEESED